MSAKETQKRTERNGLCAYCAARGLVVEGTLSYRHTASGANLLCQQCWEALHDDWLRLYEAEAEEIPFDNFVEKVVADAKVIYRRKHHEGLFGSL